MKRVFLSVVLVAVFVGTTHAGPLGFFGRGKCGGQRASRGCSSGCVSQPNQQPAQAGTPDGVIHTVVYHPGVGDTSGGLGYTPISVGNPLPVTPCVNGVCPPARFVR